MAFDREGMDEPIGDGGVCGGWGVWPGGGGLQALDHIAVIGGYRSETRTRVGDGAVVESHGEQEIVREGSVDWTAAYGCAGANGGASSVEGSRGIGVGELELVEVQRAGGAAGECDGDRNRRATSGYVGGIKSLRILQRSVPVGGPQRADVSISFVIGDGSGKRLVAPLHGDDDEISADARGGKRLGKRGSGGDRGFRVLNKGNRRRRSDPLRCGGGQSL